MSDERDLIAAARSAGRGPTAESRDSIRSALVAEMRGETSVTVTQPADHARRRWLTVATAGLAAAAAAVVAVVMISSGDDNTRIGPTDSAPNISDPAPPSSTSSAADEARRRQAEEARRLAAAAREALEANRRLAAASKLLSEVLGHRWIAVELDAAPWQLAYVPYLEFDSSARTGATGALLGGNDGCNWYGATGSLDGDLLELEPVESTAMDCGPGTGGVMPVDGDRVVVADDSATLELRDPGGRARLRYARLDALGPAGADTLQGRWALDDSAPSPVVFGDGGSGTFGTCGWSWTITDTLTARDWPDDPYQCLGGSADQTSSRLIEMFVRGPVATHLDQHGTVLYLADAQFVIRLTKLVDPTPDTGE